MTTRTAGPRPTARPLRDAGDLEPLMDRIGGTGQRAIPCDHV